jgi:hypothetical protein
MNPPAPISIVPGDQSSGVILAAAAGGEGDSGTER